MAMQSGFIKRIRDIMRMDAGINGDAQRIEQMLLCPLDAILLWVKIWVKAVLGKFQQKFTPTFRPQKQRKKS